MQLKNLINSKESLQKLFNSEKLNAVIAFRLSKIIKEVEELFDRYETIRTKKILKYGEKTEDNSIIVKPEFQEQFQKEMLEVLEEEIKIDLPIIKLSDIPDGVLNSYDFLNLEYLIKE